MGSGTSLVCTGENFVGIVIGGETDAKGVWVGSREVVGGMIGGEFDR